MSSAPQPTWWRVAGGMSGSPRRSVEGTDLSPVGWAPSLKVSGPWRLRNRLLV